MRISIAVLLAVVLSSAQPLKANDKPIAARVNGTPITFLEVNQLAAQMTSASDTKVADEDARSAALETLIDIELLLQTARAEKIQAADAEVDSQLREVQAQFPNPEAFQAALADAGTTESSLRQDIARQLTVQELLQRHTAVDLPEDAAAVFYKENQKQFEHPAQVRLSHILFRRSGDTDPDQAKTRASETLARLQNGESFDDLAKELSKDALSIDNNGDLGLLARDQMPAALADAAFRLKVGEVSGVVETPFGFHIIRVTEVRQSGTTPFDEVKPQLDGYLEEQERSRQNRAYVAKLRNDAEIERFAAPD